MMFLHHRMPEDFVLTRCCQSNRRRRKGAAIVEFAVVVPVLLLFLLGIVEYGRMLQVANVTTNASREGARYAAQADVNVDTVKTYTKDYLAAATVPNSAVQTVAVEQYSSLTSSWSDVTNLSAVPAGTPVRVRVEINFGAVTWLPSGFLVPKNSVLSSTSVTRKE